jgi:predicted phage tail protein
MTSICFPRTEPRNVRVYGQLGARFGRCFRLAVESPAEAIRALCTQLPGFEAELMSSKDRGVGYAVFVGKRNIGEDELTWRGGCEDIRIAPMLMGAKNGGIFRIIIGVILVVVGYFLSAWGYGVIGAPLSKLGWAMIIGGVMQLLMPAPKGPGELDRPENRANYSFNGPVNTQAQGNPVPLLYGELIVGSAVISAQINVEDQAYVPTPADDWDDRPDGGEGGDGSYSWYELWMLEFRDEA